MEIISRGKTIECNCGCTFSYTAEDLKEKEYKDVVVGIGHKFGCGITMPYYVKGSIVYDVVKCPDCRKIHNIREKRRWKY